MLSYSPVAPTLSVSVYLEGEEDRRLETLYARNVNGASPASPSWTPSSLGPASPSPMGVDSAYPSHRASALPAEHRKQPAHRSLSDDNANATRESEFLQGDVSSLLFHDCEEGTSHTNRTSTSAGGAAASTSAAPAASAALTTDEGEDDEEDEVVGVTAEGELLFRRRDGGRHHRWLRAADYAEIPNPHTLPSSSETALDSPDRRSGLDTTGAGVVGGVGAEQSPEQLRPTFAAVMVTPNHAVAPVRPTPHRSHAAGPPHAIGSLTLRYTAAAALSPMVHQSQAQAQAAHRLQHRLRGASPSVEAVDAVQDPTTTVVEVSPAARWLYQMSMRMRDRENDVYYEMVEDEVNRHVQLEEAADRELWMLRMQSRNWDLRRM